MAESIIERFSPISLIELRYNLDGGISAMDAFVQNKCEHEILAALKDIADYFDLSISVDTLAFEAGSIKRVWKVKGKAEGNNSPVRTAVISAVLTAILAVPITKFAEKSVEKWFEDPELKQLEKDNKRLENKKLELELKEMNKSAQAEEKNEKQEKQQFLRKRAANFYDQLNRYEKVDSVSISARDEKGDVIIPERKINRRDFVSFVNTDDDLPSIFIDDARIEIISPVLKRGRYKWVGIYEKSPIHFTMKSAEFRELVQSGKVEFRNGFTIECLLEIKRKIGNDGLEHVAGYDVLTVNRYFENNQPIETAEGRSRRRGKTGDGRQLGLFDEPAE